MRRASCAWSVVALLTVAAGASAQDTTTSRRFGFTASVNSATIAGKDVTAAKALTRGAVGALLVFQRTPMFAIQSELLWTMKGADDPNNGAGLHMEYLELPLLARFDFGARMARPFIYAGPSIAYNTSCHFVVTDPAAPGTYSCDAVAELGGTRFKKVDYTMIAGGGVAFHIGRPIITIGAHYDYGLGRIAEDSDAKHRVGALVSAIEFPMGRLTKPAPLGPRR
jgi:hypothetical protein